MVDKRTSYEKEQYEEKQEECEQQILLYKKKEKEYDDKITTEIDKRKREYDDKIRDYNNLISKYKKSLKDKFNKIKYKGKKAVKLSDVECLVCCKPIDYVSTCGHFTFCESCNKEIKCGRECHLCRRTNITYHKLYT